METSPEPRFASAPPHGALRTLAERCKPRASVRAQLLLAAGLWTLAAGILGFRAFTWLAEEPLLLAAGGIGIGLLKASFLLDGVAARGRARIDARGRDACAGGFQSVGSWLLVIAMIAGGHALRLTSLPRPWLGVLYAAVATALLVASRIYWRAAFAPRAAGPA